MVVCELKVSARNWGGDACITASFRYGIVISQVLTEEGGIYRQDKWIIN